MKDFIRKNLPHWIGSAVTVLTAAFLAGALHVPQSTAVQVGSAAGQIAEQAADSAAADVAK